MLSLFRELAHKARVAIITEDPQPEYSLLDLQDLGRTLRSNATVGESNE